MMRIAVVVDKFNRNLGGREQYLWSLLPGLANLGYKVRVYCSECPVIPDNIEVEIVSTGLIPTFLREWSFCRRADLRIKSFDPDATFSVQPLNSATHYRISSGLTPDLFEAERESLKPGIRYSLYPFGQALNLRRQISIRNELKILSDNPGLRIMTNSELVKKALISRYGFDRKSVITAYSGIDLDFFKPANTSRENFEKKVALKLLFVGHNFLRKGLKCLMDTLAFEELGKLEIHLTVAGNGQVKKFSQYADQIGIGSKINFLNTRTREETVRVYQSHDALFLPTFYDPCSLACLEAMACGLPVVTTSRNGASELITSHHNGFIVDRPTDVKGLADSIRKLTNEATRRRMSKEARNAALDLDLNTHVKKVSNWLESGQVSVPS